GPNPPDCRSRSAPDRHRAPPGRPGPGHRPARRPSPVRTEPAPRVPHDRATRNHPVTTNHPDPGTPHLPSSPGPTTPRPARDGGPHGPRFGSDAVAPGTLTAVPHPDQSQTTQKGHPVTYPGPPRPVQLSATPLTELADQLGAPAPEHAPEVTGITHDSRAVRPGDLYAALPGARAHGADFVSQAASLGAVAVLTDPAGAERVA